MSKKEINEKDLKSATGGATYVRGKKIEGGKRVN